MIFRTLEKSGKILNTKIQRCADDKEREVYFANTRILRQRSYKGYYRSKKMRKVCYFGTDNGRGIKED